MSIELAIMESLQKLFEVAEERNPNGNNIVTAIGEVEVNGIKYQIQLELVSDQKIWLKEDEIRLSEVVKLHD